jgi:hypothetical protein
MADSILEKDKAVQDNGSLYWLSPYISWEPGDFTAELDGEFTAADLRAIADHMDKAA